MNVIIALGGLFISSASFGAAVMLFLVQRNEIKVRNERQEVDNEKFWDEILCEDEGDEKE